MNKYFVLILAFFCVITPVIAQNQTQEKNDYYYSLLYKEISEQKKNISELKDVIEQMRINQEENLKTSFQTLDSEMKKTIEDKTNLVRFLPFILFQLGLFFLTLAIIGILKLKDFIYHLSTLKKLRCVCGNFCKEENNVFECEVCKRKYEVIK